MAGDILLIPGFLSAQWCGPVAALDACDVLAAVSALETVEVADVKSSTAAEILLARARRFLDKPIIPVWMLPNQGRSISAFAPMAQTDGIVAGRVSNLVAGALMMAGGRNDGKCGDSSPRVKNATLEKALETHGGSRAKNRVPYNGIRANDSSYPDKGIVGGNENDDGMFHHSIKNRGGAYLGIGSSQNYKLAAHARSELVFMIDVGENVYLSHVVMKGLFLISNSTEDLQQNYDHLKGGNKSDLVLRIKAVLSEEEFSQISAFIKSDEDVGHKPLSQDEFSHLRYLFQNNRIIPVRSNLDNSQTFAQIRTAVSEAGLKIAVVYLTNVTEHGDSSDVKIDYDVFRKMFADDIFSDDGIVLRTSIRTPHGCASGLFGYQVINQQNHRRLISQADTMMDYNMTFVEAVSRQYQTDNPTASRSEPFKITQADIPQTSVSSEDIKNKILDFARYAEKATSDPKDKRSYHDYMVFALGKLKSVDSASYDGFVSNYVNLQHPLIAACYLDQIAGSENQNLGKIIGRLLDLNEINSITDKDSRDSLTFSLSKLGRGDTTQAMIDYMIQYPQDRGHILVGISINPAAMDSRRICLVIDAIIGQLPNRTNRDDIGWRMTATETLKKIVNGQDQAVYWKLISLRKMFEELQPMNYQYNLRELDATIRACNPGKNPDGGRNCV
ncbi:MAG: hypothetical protein Q7T03_00260 [Deltaproteobacteria bacterium]|nr:hypothetical protein [Deltaproteobacteria bacterium]